MARAIANTAISNVLTLLQSNLAVLDAGVTMLFGAEYLNYEGGANQIVAVPTEDRFEGAHVNATQPGGGQKVLRNCWTTIEFNIWGMLGVQNNGVDSFDDVYSIRSELIQTLQDTLQGGSYKVLRGGWLKGEQSGGQEGSELNQYGRWYVLAVEFWNPIVRSVPQTARITSLPETLTLLRQTSP